MTVASAPRPALLGLSEDDLARAIRDAAPERFRAAQVARWLYERRAADFSEMTDLPKALREGLAARFVVGLPDVAARTPAEDSSEKFLFELRDGARVEAVFIPARERITICLSSQAGCAVDCAFCVTGRMGAGRSLTAGEIVGQYLAIARARGFGAHEANVVFMGMGEPLLNLPGLFGALDLLEREVAPRRITVSTSGIVPGIDALAARERRPNLAVSLCAADDETRTRLMPINAKYPLAELFAALKRWPLEKGRRITFEYVLIEGVNDDLATARRLARLVGRVPSKVNLIPLNESAEWLPGLKRPTEAAVDAFGRALAEAGVAVTVRWSKGLGANAACGQLKGRVEPRRAARAR
ncbi:MAG TPA: 23S rRNA (adenine(2503)-C(2))-methyltransferase RlmN [Thermoanaerobaculia bacterium]|nr:23S rRNA (adenine(2503)-C(2))-methyltransferase RlmN [Thermoanaerobaculia bacterium]